MKSLNPIIECPFCKTTLERKFISSKLRKWKNDKIRWKCDKCDIEISTINRNLHIA